MTEENSSVLNRVRTPSHSKKNSYLFGVHVPKTVGTVILDGKGRKIVQVDAKEMEYA